MDKLKTTPARQANHELTHVKIINCSRMFTTQEFKACKEVINLSTLIRWFQSLRELEKGPTSNHILGPGPCLKPPSP